MCLESFGGRQLHVTEQKLNYAKSNITVSSYTELAGAAISSRMHIFYNKTFRKQKAVGLSPLSNQFFFFFDGYQRVYRKLINPIILPLETILRNAFFNSKLRFVFFVNYCSCNHLYCSKRYAIFLLYPKIQVATRRHR